MITLSKPKTERKGVRIVIRKLGAANDSKSTTVYGPITPEQMLVRIEAMIALEDHPSKRRQS